MKGLLRDKVPTTDHETRFMIRDRGNGAGFWGSREIVCERNKSLFCIIKKISGKFLCEHGSENLQLTMQS
jgi:hypothetical protein